MAMSGTVLSWQPASSGSSLFDHEMSAWRVLSKGQPLPQGRLSSALSLADSLPMGILQLP
jgi:hypothetical protein